MGSGMRVFVELFAGGDFYAETVGRERNGAGGVGIIGAGRIVGLVEIELDGFAIGAVLGSFGIEEPGGWVGKFAASEIAKDDEETAVTIGFGFEAVFLAVQSEEDVTNDVQLYGIAKNILGVELFGRIIGNEASGEVEGIVDGEPVQASEAFEQGAMLVLEAEGETIAAGVDKKREIAEDEAVLRIVWAQIGGFDGLAVDGGGDTRMDVNGGFSGMEIESAGLRGSGDGKNDVIQRVGTEMVLAFVEPEEAGDGEPTVFGSELGFVIVAPFFDGLAISEGVRSGGAGEEKNCEKQSERALPTVKVHGMLPSRVNQNSTTNE